MAAMALRQHLSRGLAAAIPSLGPLHRVAAVVAVQLLALQMLSRTVLMAVLVAAVRASQPPPELWERQRLAKATMVAQAAQVARLHLVAAVVAARVDALALTETQQRVATAALAHHHLSLAQQ
jgi:hypothetical protein